VPKKELLSRADTAYPAKPTGWFQIGWSDDFAVGDVTSLHYFNQDLVAYRTASGSLLVIDAYCPHFGAHLGHGGRVDGDYLVCPFHGWTWDAEGRNVSIPYSARTNKSKRLLRYPVGFQKSA